MSNSVYVKRIRSPKAELYRAKHTSAYLILDALALHARRNYEDEECHPLLYLHEGIVTAEMCGVGKHQFSSGIKFLESKGDIEIIHRGRKDKNSKLLTRPPPPLPPKKNGIKTESTNDSNGIKNGINGTVLRLTKSDIWDINAEDERNQKRNQNGINSRKKPAQIRREALASQEEEHEEEKKEKRPAWPASGKVCSILEAWERDELLELRCMLIPDFTKYLKEFFSATIHTLSDVNPITLEEFRKIPDKDFISAAIGYAKSQGFDEEHLKYLRDEKSFKIAEVVLFIYKLSQKKGPIDDALGLLIKMRKEDDPNQIAPLKTKSKKKPLRRIQIDPVESSQASFGEGSIYIPPWMQELEKKTAN